jgi:hypothetical protein
MSTEKISIDFIDSHCREIKLQLRLPGPTSICHVFPTARPTTADCCLWPVTSRVTTGALSPELLTLQPASRRVASYYFVNNSISMFPPPSISKTKIILPPVRKSVIRLRIPCRAPCSSRRPHSVCKHGIDQICHRACHCENGKRNPCSHSDSLSFGAQREILKNQEQSDVGIWD